MDWASGLVSHLLPSGACPLVISGFLDEEDSTSPYSIQPLTLGCLVLTLFVRLSPSGLIAPVIGVLPLSFQDRERLILK